MNKSLDKWRKPTILGLVMLLTIGVAHFTGAGNVSVKADSNAQTLPFSQNWSNAGLITTDDDWSGVPGIIGYRGDDLVTGVDTDLRTILADGSATPVDVNANRNDPDTYSTGGVAEFDGIPNPTVALQGSGTADVPHLVIFLNTTGKSNIRITYNARDIDGQMADAVQQINTQYRVGATGDYANLTGGYIADASSGESSATLVTPVSVTLPAAANNQPMVQVRVMTTNALGSDDWIGIDDINVTAGGGGGTTPGAAKSTLFDFTGNGRTDWTTLTVPTSGAITWRIAGNPAASGPNQAFIRIFNYGLSNIITNADGDLIQTGDQIVPQDYSGDQKTEVSVWRPGAQSYFYTSQFPTGTAGITLERAVQFGSMNDDPTVAGDYDGDGKIDYTVVRATGGVYTWYIINSSTNTLRITNVGIPLDALGSVAVNGADFNGDGKDELVFITQKGQCEFVPGTVCSVTYYAIDAVTGIDVFIRQFGNFNSDYIITPADYTGDKKADLVAVRQSTGNQIWYINNSATNATTATQFGISDSDVRGDLQVRGDYDGDGRQDIAVWRRSNQTFYYISSANGTLGGQKWGEAGDTPLAAIGVF